MRDTEIRATQGKILGISDTCLQEYPSPPPLAAIKCQQLTFQCCFSHSLWLRLTLTHAEEEIPCSQG